MSMADALYWERLYVEEGWLVKDPEDELMLLTRPIYIEKYGKEALGDYWYSIGRSDLVIALELGELD